jgi:hypothetical protein
VLGGFARSPVLLRGVARLAAMTPLSDKESQRSPSTAEFAVGFSCWPELWFMST